MILYSHLFQNFPQFIVIYTVKGFDIVNKAKIDVFFWNSLAFSMIQQMLSIWSLVPLPFLNPAWTSEAHGCVFKSPGLFIYLFLTISSLGFLFLFSFWSSCLIASNYLSLSLFILSSVLSGLMLNPSSESFNSGILWYNNCTIQFSYCIVQCSIVLYRELLIFFFHFIVPIYCILILFIHCFPDCFQLSINILFCSLSSFKIIVLKFWSGNS